MEGIEDFVRKRSTRQVESQEMIRPDSRIGFQKVRESLRSHHSSDEKNECKSYLGNYKHASQLRMAFAAPPGNASHGSLFQREVWIGARGARRGGESKQNSRHQRTSKSEPEHRGIRGDFIKPGCTCWSDLPERTDS